MSICSFWYDNCVCKSLVLNSSSINDNDDDGDNDDYDDDYDDDGICRDGGYNYHNNV